MERDRPPLFQNFHGEIGNVAGRDIHIHGTQRGARLNNQRWEKKLYIFDGLITSGWLYLTSYLVFLSTLLGYLLHCWTDANHSLAAHPNSGVSMWPIWLSIPLLFAMLVGEV